MSGSGTETLTAALRRLADEHASGLLAVATPGRDVVMELADGTPVGIGPTHDVSERVGRGAGPSLVAAAVVDALIDRTVAAIVDGDGDWTWDVSSDTDMMPVPQGLASELSRRAVDAAQALATLDPQVVLQPGRDLGTSGEVARIRDLFDGDRSIEEVAAEASITVPACATVAAALVRAGVLTTGTQDTGPPSWTDTVAGADGDEDDDEPELWVMDEPDDLDESDDELDESDEPDDVDDFDESDESEDVGEFTAEEPATTPVDRDDTDVAQQAHRPTEDTDRAAAAATSDEDIAQAVEWVAGDDEQAAATPATPAATGPAAATSDDATSDDSDDGWDDTSWLDDLGDTSAAVRPRDDDEDGPPGSHGGDQRSALSSMISELQGSGSGEVESREQAPPARTADQDDAAKRKKATDASRKEPRAEPGEVAEFLRELSRLALDED